MPDLKVALAEVKEESDSGVTETAARPTAKGRSRLLWGVGSIVCAAAITAGVWFVLSKPRASESPLVAAPITSEAVFESNATFSPDGNQVAYARTTDGSDTESSRSTEGGLRSETERELATKCVLRAGALLVNLTAERPKLPVGAHSGETGDLVTPPKRTIAAFLSVE